MKKIIFIAIFVLFPAIFGNGQTIRVNPTGVNVNSQNATVVYLTFGQIPAGYVPAEAIWCGKVIPATAPAQGLRCDPNTIYGSLPARYNLSQTSGNQGFTDIMSIPPSVVRRAYQAAVRGASAGFFYVRRFVSNNGQPDQFVNVTCRMTGGGARVPFALTDVKMKTPQGEPILFLQTGEPFPEVEAEIRYNGTGRLKGRWEIVLPGEELPSENDLLTEATLPIEDRASQKRYTQIARFNHFLPPNGKFTLKLEKHSLLPISAEGQYLLLLRIEAVNDKESDSDLRVLGVGNGVVHSGAVAGFPMPTIKFFVGSKAVKSVQPDFLFTDSSNKDIQTWRSLKEATFYRLEFVDEAGNIVFSAITVQPNYRLPSWFKEKFAGKSLQKRLYALDENGKIIGTEINRQPIMKFSAPDKTQ